jgi:tetratricopeptide (TPR) repeat protein
VLRQDGKLGEALAAMEQAAAIGRARLGKSPTLARLINRVGSILVEQGRERDAIEMLERAIAMGRETMAADDVRLANLIGDAGTAALGMGRLDEARARYESQLAIFARRGKPDMNWVIGLLNLATLHGTAQRPREGLALLERALAMTSELHGDPNPYAIQILTQIARAHTQLEDWRAAIAAAERALPLRPADFDPSDLAGVRYFRAIARWHVGIERSAALAEVRAVRAVLVEAGASGAIGELDAWLAKHAP